MFGRAWAFVTAHPAAIIASIWILALVVLSGTLFVDRAALRGQLAVAQADLALAKAAQAPARAAQVAVNHHPAVVSATIAEMSDAQASAYYERGRAAGAAYAAANRVCTSPADQPGNADLSGADYPTPFDDRSGDAADMVALSRADFDLLTGNSARLAQVHQDADALISAGIAIAPSGATPR